MGKTFRRGGNERGYYSLVNLSVTSEQKVAQTVQTGQTKTMTINPKDQRKVESSTLKLTTTVDDTEIENESEELEFDDLSEVDYDLDYTVQY